MIYYTKKKLLFVGKQIIQFLFKIFINRKILIKIQRKHERVHLNFLTII